MRSLLCWKQSLGGLTLVVVATACRVVGGFGAAPTFAPFAGEDARWMKLALDEAGAAGRRGEVPIGAVVVRDGAVLARGGNSVERDSDASAHAELIALRSAASAEGNWRLLNATLYCTR